MGREGRYARGIFCTGEIEIKNGETMGEKKNPALKKLFYVHFFCVKLGSKTSWVLVCSGGGFFFLLMKGSIPNLNL